MSNNVEHFDYIGDGRLYIRRGDAVGLLVVYEDELAEGNWLERLDDDGELVGDQDEMLLIDAPSWFGQFSGVYMDVLVKKLLPQTKGFAELYFVYENGTLYGLEINDGRVTEKDVRVSLV